MTQSKLEQIMAEVRSFPSMPSAAAKLLALFDDPDTTISQIEEILRTDPGLTANVLKLTNSSYFGLTSKVGSVRQAIALLGSKILIQLVLVSSVNAAMDKPVPGYDLPPGELWRHSIAVSVAAEGLVKELKVPGADVIFTAALLHDVGKLILGNFLKEDIKQIELAASRGISFEKAEHSVLNTNHAEIGAQIMQNWSLPPQIVSAVQWHHAPEAGAKTNPITDIVHVSDVLCQMIGIGAGRKGLRFKPSNASTKRLGLTPHHVEKVASQTLQWVAELSDVLDSN
jgi:putative nucleotidyltransferase with HDIG domain